MAPRAEAHTLHVEGPSPVLGITGSPAHHRLTQKPNHSEVGVEHDRKGLGEGQTPQCSGTAPGLFLGYSLVSVV